MDSPLLEEASSENYHAPINSSFIGKSLIVLTVLLFSLFSSPRLQAREQALNAASLLELTNQDRALAGSSPLQESLKLDQAASAKAQDILEKGYFAHVAPSGTKPWDFIKGVDFQYSFAGENLALNYESALELENDFMNSPSHRDNLLSPLFSQIGIAIVHGTFQGKPATITVEMFASPK